MPKLRNPLPPLPSVCDLTDLAYQGREFRDWYTLAKAQVIAGAAVLDCPPQRFADLLALFSPRVSVVRSVRFAVHYIRQYHNPNNGRFLHDVTRSVRAAVDHYEKTGGIRGPKTSAFARAIMGDSDAIVLDTWMGRAFGIDGKRFEVKTIREMYESHIRLTATKLKWSPAETQAAIWGATVVASGRRAPLLLIEPELDGVPI